MEKQKTVNDRLRDQYVQVVVSIRHREADPLLLIDPWSNCPSEIAKEEGRLCNECEFWGRKVQGMDWSEFSLCLFDGTEVAA